MRMLIAVICPPLAVLLTGNRSGAVVNAGLTLLFYVPGLLHALAEVDRHSTVQRYEAVMQALDRAAVV